MTNPCLALEGASFVLPDGRTLFSDLTEQFDQRPTGLVGRNGAGKTVLARMLAGQVQPAAGRCTRHGSVYYLAQQISHPPGATVSDLAGVRTILDALERIEAGSSAPEDFDAVGERWDIRLRLQHELERNGLGHLDAATPASALSGGEAMRVTLAGALLSDADFLVLDEPSNHLDRPNRQALVEQLQRWPRGLLVVSHDRQLLGAMARIVELSSLGLRSYGGNYAFFAQCKEQEQQSAIQQLEQRKLEQRREAQALREQGERLERRQARGNRQGHEANQARILLGRQKERSESSAGKLRQQHAAARAQSAERVREAAQRVENDLAIVVHELPVALRSQRRVAELEAVELPFVRAATRHLSLTLTGQQRIGVVGPNGCGKSTMLKVLARQLEPLAGTCRMSVEGIYLDQRLASLDPQRTVLEQMLEANGTATEGDLRMRLAHLGLDHRKIAAPGGSLSGGERLKAALACVLYADPPPHLLLLDEPSNHLDLPSVQALEAMLRGYQGALVVVFHDDAFMDSLGLTDRLVATGQGWRTERW
ncbi:ABC-F family ATP-binding cassette domain-containing protein [Cupriavidus taiwanensis]|nr:ABC-F family ATP-binding cassette domain-containing protein [Cupriavidus taiwanensis]SOZ29816.1 putative ABC transporter ATP-binding protein [Cupriavidus taiwanensis]SPA34597.1 putative ABC transporter ATP-binding protein [Cupriavidus taiwanensis]